MSLRVMLERRSAKGLYREVSLDEMLKQVQHDIVSELSFHNVFARLHRVMPVPIIGDCIACELSLKPEYFSCNRFERSRVLYNLVLIRVCSFSLLVQRKRTKRKDPLA